jgi:hypothetical protein
MEPFRLKPGVSAARFARAHEALAGLALESSDKYLLKLFPPL